MYSIYDSLEVAIYTGSPLDVGGWSSRFFSDSITSAIKKAHIDMASSEMATRIGARPGGVAMLL